MQKNIPAGTELFWAHAAGELAIAHIIFLFCLKTMLTSRVNPQTIIVNEALGTMQTLHRFSGLPYTGPYLVDGLHVVQFFLSHEQIVMGDLVFRKCGLMAKFPIPPA